MSSARLLSICGVMLSWAYLLNGFHNLVVKPGGGCDLERRHAESQLLLRGENPYSAFIAHVPYLEARFAGSLTPEDYQAPYHPSSVPAYPPWALPLIIVTAGAPAPIYRWLFAGLNVLLLVLLSSSLSRLAHRELGIQNRYVVTGCLMVSTIGMTLGVGQYGLLVIVAVLLAARAEESKRWAIAGFLLAAAMIKPNIALPLLIVFVAKRSFRALAVAGATLSVLAGVGCWLIRTDPLVAFLQSYALSRHLISEGDSPVSLLSDYFPHGNLVGTSLTLLIATTILWRQRHRGFLVLLAIAAFFGRIWTYHRYYDNLMMIPLIASLGYLLVENRRHRGLTIIYAAVALTLWPSPKMWQCIVDTVSYFAAWWGISAASHFQIWLEVLSWAAGVGIVLRLQFRAERKEARVASIQLRASRSIRAPSPAAVRRLKPGETVGSLTVRGKRLTEGA